MTHYNDDKYKSKQSEELSARLSGAKTVYKVVKSYKKDKLERDKWNSEAEKQRLKIVNKYRKNK
jgi:hypothetical protein